MDKRKLELKNNVSKSIRKLAAQKKLGSLNNISRNRNRPILNATEYVVVIAENCEQHDDNTSYGLAPTDACK